MTSGNYERLNFARRNMHRTCAQRILFPPVRGDDFPQRSSGPTLSATGSPAPSDTDTHGLEAGVKWVKRQRPSRVLKIRTAEELSRRSPLPRSSYSVPLEPRRWTETRCFVMDFLKRSLKNHPAKRGVGCWTFPPQTVSSFLPRCANSVFLFSQQ